MSSCDDCILIGNLWISSQRCCFPTVFDLWIIWAKRRSVPWIQLGQMDGDATVRFDLSTTVMETICDFTWDSAL